ncbi:hypothetical protein COUCH_19910 [Couchioplanes caeruleus]|uniref:hypothetical protein n=1 Tax=Couchioplanes caeruleus TaxID=56438 RepID=UPI0020C16E3E|nr:hypothetical protein [Couchioplanes caeruleus]UQU61330.1 hypothetical protein COUCH_19910 [Couchioplanes caeruleus]
MRRDVMPLFLCGAVLALAGCAATAAGPALPAPAASSAGPAPAPAVRPALCDGRKPAPRDPFPYNRDAARRDAMLHFYDLGGGERYVGGAAHFDSLDAAGLAALIQARYIDPYEQQNAAPPVWDIFRFLCRHPQVRAMGYVISIDRPDYRASLETVYAQEIDPQLREEALTFCADADAVETGDHLECFWD